MGVVDGRGSLAADIGLDLNLSRNVSIWTRQRDNMQTNLDATSNRSDTTDLEEFERMSFNDPLDVFPFNERVIGSDKCKTCFTDPTSPRLRLPAGGGELSRGGRGGGAAPGVILNTARGGGGSGPAMAWTPG
jgi:hypothetical protein